MKKEDARKQLLEVLHERRKQVVCAAVTVSEQ